MGPTALWKAKTKAHLVSVCFSPNSALGSALPASGLLLGPELSSFLPHNHLAAEPSLSHLQSQHNKQVQISGVMGRGSLQDTSDLSAGLGGEGRGRAGRASPLCKAAVETGQERGLPGIEEMETGRIDHSFFPKAGL